MGTAAPLPHVRLHTPSLVQTLPSAALWHWVLALGAGLAQAASLALPGSGAPAWWLQLLSLAGLAWLVRPGTQPRRGMALAFMFTTTWLVGTFWWLFISLHTYGGLAAPLAVLAIVGLAAFLASYYALGLGLFCTLRHNSRALTAIVFGAIWLLAELARGIWWTGFPWGAGGYAHVDGPLAALARSVGVYGVGFVAAVLVMLLVQIRQSDVRSLRAWVLVAGMLATLLALDAQRQRALALPETSAAIAAPLTLALLQGFIPQDEKFQPGSGVPMALQWYGEQLQGAKAQLVVAPETAIALLPGQLPPGYLEAVTQRYTEGNQAALVGIPMGSLDQGYTNSVLGWKSGVPVPYRYDKHHLVPFGEFIPPLFRWFTELMHIPLGDFSRGALVQPAFEFRGQRLAPNICYEDLFGEELGARFADPASAPTVFVNLSNIGWFGNTVAIDQHLAISRMRAIEFERPMVRATNTGATAVIDHRGMVLQQLPRDRRGVLLGQVQGRSGAPTLYAVWVSRWGLWPLWGGALVVVLAALLHTRRMRQRCNMAHLLATGQGNVP